MGLNIRRPLPSSDSWENLGRQLKEMLYMDITKLSASETEGQSVSDEEKPKDFYV